MIRQPGRATLSSKIVRLNKALKKLRGERDAAVQEFAELTCPLEIGTTVVLPDHVGRVESIQGVDWLGSGEYEWRATVRLLKVDGKDSKRTREIDADTSYTVYISDAEINA